MSSYVLCIAFGPIAVNCSCVIWAPLFIFVHSTPCFAVCIYIGSRLLKVPGSDDCKQLYMVLCDLSTTVQAMGRLSDHFTDDVFSSRLNDAQTLVTK